MGNKRQSRPTSAGKIELNSWKKRVLDRGEAGQDKGKFRQGRNGDHRPPGRHLCTGGLVAHPCRQLAKPAVALSDKQKVSPVPRRALAELTVATAR
jgi:hypothetical protein